MTDRETPENLAVAHRDAIAKAARSLPDQWSGRRRDGPAEPAALHDTTPTSVGGAPADESGFRLAAIGLPVALAVAIVAGITVFHPGPNHRPVVARDPIDVGGLPTLTSRNGLLEATLSAGPLAVQIGDANFAGAGYNGSYGGPVLRVRPGDRVVLHLDNHMADAINLHFHGLRITPLGHGDNMHVLVAPGTSYDYDFRIPANHPPGLFWYHDHAHGAAEPHVMAGLSGALLIEGFAGQFKGLSDVPQKLLVLKDWKQPDCTGAVLKTALHCRVVSINGGGAWADALARGDTQLWRVSNQGANLILHLVAPGLRMRVVGRDGMPATDGQDGAGFDIMPASRVDVLVHAEAPGSFSLMAVGVPTKTAAGFSIKRTLGVVTVAGASRAAPAPPVAFPHQQDMQAWKIDARRMIVFSENLKINEYYVNGRKFDPLRTDVRAPLGNVEEWTIRNATDDFHEFHIHQLSFQVTAINGAPQKFSGYVDDVKVPEHGEVKVIIPFTDPTIIGHIMFHCHVLNHEDRGMMTMLEVYRPSVPHICNVPAR